MWVTIETDNAGEPSGTPVTNGTSDQVKASLIGNTADWHKFVFPGDISLSSSTKYWIVLHGDYAQDDAHHIAWRADTSAASFSGGESGRHANGGAWTIDTDDDFLFRVLEATAGTGYEVSAGTLVFQPGELTATYQSLAIDLSSVDLYGIKINYLGTNLSSVLIEISTSDDDITYSSFSQWFPADYNMRYYKVRVTITRANSNVNASLDELTLVADKLT